MKYLEPQTEVSKNIYFFIFFFFYHFFIWGCKVVFIILSLFYHYFITIISLFGHEFFHRTFSCFHILKFCSLGKKILIQ